MQQTSPLEIGLPVRDLDRMVSFYQTVFSCREVRRADIPAALSAGLAAAPDGYVNVWLQFPGGEVIKLMRPPQTPAVREQTDHLVDRTGLAYFTLYVADIAEGVSQAEADGATLLSDRSLLAGSAGVKLGFLRDPEGNVFELVEQP